MPENLPSLTDQLANRLKLFATNLGLSQRKVARLLKIDPGQLSRFLDQKVGVSSEMALKIVRLTSLTKQQLDLKFGERISSKILYLQEAGKPMKLDGSGWTAKEGGTDDPNDTTGIDNTWKEGGEPCGDDLLDTLRQIDSFHRQAREAIAGYIAAAQKAKVQSGPSESPRHVTDNADSSKPGSRGGKFTVPPRSIEHQKRLVTMLNAAAEEADRKLALGKSQVEEKLALAKEVELAWKKAHRSRKDLEEFSQARK